MRRQRKRNNRRKSSSLKRVERWAICFGEPNAARVWLKPWLNRRRDPSVANSGDKSFGVYWVAFLAERVDARIFGGFGKRKGGPRAAFLQIVLELCLFTSSRSRPLPLPENYFPSTEKASSTFPGMPPH